MASIMVTQTRGTSGHPPEQIRVLRALGLRRVGRTKTHKDNNCIRGMINKVRHLVSYKLVK